MDALNLASLIADVSPPVVKTESKTRGLSTGASAKKSKAPAEPVVARRSMRQKVRVSKYWDEGYAMRESLARLHVGM